MALELSPIDFGRIAPSNPYGFHGFAAVADLRATRMPHGPWGAVPELPGVYLVVRDSDTPPRFLEQGSGGFFKGEDPNVAIDVLGDAWVPNARIMYIGMAGRQTLRKRLKQYIDFGAGKRAGHRGGRYVWQLADARELTICWRPIEAGDPRDAEHALIQAFKHRYGARPFANLRD